MFNYYVIYYTIIHPYYSFIFIIIDFISKVKGEDLPMPDHRGPEPDWLMIYLELIQNMLCLDTLNIQSSVHSANDLIAATFISRLFAFLLIIVSCYFR